ncbi:MULTISPECIES: nucleotidyltransferase family protein [unclassified Helicobacter]|uniref:nucleotidyltransferase family protein n=1 Tax=unclassified Helicobacter TaxID=2593540 RepID=UPI00131583DD|nr:MULTISPECIES: nucleotidyltransferase family protein [unclassified Helicobacter]
MKQDNLAILILAGGLSKRLGYPKQLVEYQGQSLLQNSIVKSLSVCKNVYVLLGNMFEECKKQSQGAKIIYHQDYDKGIGSSIKAGVRELLDFDFILITLCDYPLLPQEHLRALIDHRDTQKITATLCDNFLSSPAIFPKKIYPLLLELEDKKGAKTIIQNNPNIPVKLDKKYLLDIDTTEDIKRLSSLI